MVACAGLGERLLPLSTMLPKPAFPLLDHPLVDFNLALLAQAGVESVVVNTHHLADAMAGAASDGCLDLGLGLQLSHEPVLLGTGGGLKRVEAWLRGGTFLLVNGKILFDVDLGAALEAHRRAGAVATLVVTDLPAGEGYRPVYATAGGRLAHVPGFEPEAPSGTPYLFTGIHVLEAEIFRHLPSVEDRAYGIFEHGYRGLVDAGGKVIVHRDGGAFHDPSTLSRYLRANLDAAAGRFPLARFARLGLEALTPEVGYLAPGAEVHGEVHESVIGPGAVVPQGAQVVRSVVWPGTRIAAGERLEGGIAAGEIRLAIG